MIYPTTQFEMNYLENIYDAWIQDRQVNKNIVNGMEENRMENEEENIDRRSFEDVMALIDMRPRRQAKKVIAPKPIKMLSERTINYVTKMKLERAEEKARNGFKIVLEEMKELFAGWDMDDYLMNYTPVAYTWELEKEDETCPICLDDLNENKVAEVTCCNTKFCWTCINNSLPTCPSCLKKIGGTNIKVVDNNKVDLATPVKKQVETGKEIKQGKCMSGNYTLQIKDKKEITKRVKKEKTISLPVFFSIDENDKKEIVKLMQKTEQAEAPSSENEIDNDESEEEDIIIQYHPSILSDEQKKFAVQRASEIEKLRKIKADKNRMRNQKKQEEKKEEKKQEKKKQEDKSKTKTNLNATDKNQKMNIQESNPFTRYRINKSVMCKKNACDKSRCNEAHSFEELNPVECIFGKYCKNFNECEYLHQNETKADLKSRLISREKRQTLSLPVSKVAPWNNQVVLHKVNLNEIIQQEKDEVNTPRSISSEASISETRKQAFEILANPEEVKKVSMNNKGSKICINVLKNGKCTRSVCTFAHSLSEFNPKECIFKDECNQKMTCEYYHPKSESISDCARRLGLKVSIPSTPCCSIQSTPSSTRPSSPCCSIQSTPSSTRPSSPCCSSRPSTPSTTRGWSIPSVPKYTTLSSSQHSTLPQSSNQPKPQEKTQEDDFQTVSYKKVDKVEKYARVCENVLRYGKCTRKICTFAHSLKQLEPKTCHFSRCIRSDCYFIHSKEDIKSYLIRLNIKI
jgi:hypothetical protein